MLPRELIEPIHHRLELVAQFAVREVEIEFLDFKEAREALYNFSPMDDVIAAAKVDIELLYVFHAFEHVKDVLRGIVVEL